MQSLRRTRRNAFTLIELLVVIAIIAILVALLLPAVQQVREAARKSQCQDHLHNLGVAIHNYESSYKRLPQAGVYGTSALKTGCATWVVGTGYSWRVLILPYVEQKPLYDRIDFINTGHHTCIGAYPLNDVYNSIIDVYLCPSDSTEPSVFSQGSPNPTTAPNSNPVGTNYAAAVRARADQSHGDQRNDDATKDLGALTRGGITMAGFVDGSSNTVLVGEVWRGKRFAHCSGGTPEVVNSCTTLMNRQRCREWTESSGYCQINAGVAVVTTLPTTGPNAKQYQGRFRINDTNQDQVSWPDRIAAGSIGGRPMSSAHAGGAQACMGDAKVRFVSENVDFIALAHAFSADGGEANALTGN